MSLADKRIIWTRPDGGVSVMIPSPNFKGTIHELVAKAQEVADTPEVVHMSLVPTDRTFRDAWKRGEQGQKVGVDMVKAKDIAHTRRRFKREEEMKPYDEIIAKQIPGQNPNQAEAARAQLRQKYDRIQNDIDATTTPEELKQIIITEEL